jgi:hypothetical protein
VQRLRGWLAGWAAGGSNPFIHARLYQTRLPACIQDAFTALSSYLALTPATQETEASSSDARLDCFAHVSRVQALIVYSTIRLFDSDIRQRYLAEQQLPTLYAWSHEMLASAGRAAGNGHLLLSNGIDGGLGLDQDLAGEVVPPAKQEEILWHAWILSESVRRTWLVAQMVCAIYLTLQRGFAECPGGLMFTTPRRRSRGLRCAPSATSASCSATTPRGCWSSTGRTRSMSSARR